MWTVGVACCAAACLVVIRSYALDGDEQMIVKLDKQRLGVATIVGLTTGEPAGSNTAAATNTAAPAPPEPLVTNAPAPSADTAPDARRKRGAGRSRFTDIDGDGVDDSRDL